jgi:hypothetical protein
MRGITPSILVRRLLEYEASQNNDQGGLAGASEHVSRKLSSHLSKIIGREGCRTLFMRAAKLTTREYPSFGSVEIAQDSSLSRYQDNPQADSKSAAAFLEHIFNLLITFIGEDLTLQVVGAVWPELSQSAADSSETELL